MKPHELQLVLDSLELVKPIADPIAKSFYERLFELIPHAKKLFTGDMERQGAMLMTSLSLAVEGLSNMEDVLPAVQALGERHYSYGVKPEYYQPAVEAFLWALEQHLDDDFTPALKDAWQAAFQTLADAMLDSYDML